MTIRKKTLMMMMAAAAFCLASCGNKKGGTDAATNADSTAVSQQQEAQAEEPAEELTTPDLAIFSLRGNVKTVKVTGAYHNDKFTGQQLGYDNSGRLTRLDEYNISYDKAEGGKVTNTKGRKVRRDKDGRITDVDCNDGCSEDQGYHFKYAKGKMSYTFDSGECTGLYEEVITLDDDGKEKKATCTSNDEYGAWTLTQEYTYTKHDNHGNWTERTVKWTCTEEEYNEMGDDETNNNIIKNSNGSFTQTREITYYE